MSTIARPIVMGIETSCDDTGVAILDGNGRILADKIVHQDELHAPYRGVKPDVAAKAHRSALSSTIDSVLKQANLPSIASLDAIAVTSGPGLALCLDVGISEAQRLSLEHKKPLLAVHHLEAHILVSRLPALPSAPDSSSIQFPFLSLLASGGHSMLVLSHSYGKHELLGSTLDDSAGECFDKVARLIGLGTLGSGGPKIEKFALNGDPKKYPMPVPLQRRSSSSDFNFSFSGMKTAVLRLVRQLESDSSSSPSSSSSSSSSYDSSIQSIKKAAFLDMNAVLKQSRDAETTSLSDIVKADLAASFQAAAINHLYAKASAALDHCKRTHHVKDFVVCGGVAANASLRQRFVALGEQQSVRVSFPPIKLCTDNGVMIAWAALECLKHENSVPITAGDKNVDVRPRWPLDSLLGEGTNKGGVGSGKRTLASANNK